MAPQPPIPLLDLSPLLQRSPDSHAIRYLARDVHAAFRHPGFCYIRGHGITAPYVDHLLSLASSLFALPQSAKDALDASKSPLARGYNSLEYGKHSCTPEDGQQDAKESFTVGAERKPGDPRLPSPMHGPNQWPAEQELPGWRQEAEAALHRMLGVARLFMRALALTLRPPDDFFTSRCRDPVAQMVLFRWGLWEE